MRRAMSTLIYAAGTAASGWPIRWYPAAELIQIFAARGHFNHTDRQHIRQIANWFRSTGVTFHSMHSPDCIPTKIGDAVVRPHQHCVGPVFSGRGD